jgi:hypothetical protein
MAKLKIDLMKSGQIRSFGFPATQESQKNQGEGCTVIVALLSFDDKHSEIPLTYVEPATASRQLKSLFCSNPLISASPPLREKYFLFLQTGDLSVTPAPFPPRSINKCPFFSRISQAAQTGSTVQEALRMLSGRNST